WKANSVKPGLTVTKSGSVAAQHPDLGEYQLHCEGTPTLLFCDNETNVHRLYGQNEKPGSFKDAFHEYVVNGNKTAVSPERSGTKSAALYEMAVPAGGSARIRLSLAQGNVT